MTREQEELLLTVARLLRVHLSASLERPQQYQDHDAIVNDLDALCNALAPFEQTAKPVKDAQSGT